MKRDLAQGFRASNLSSRRLPWCAASQTHCWSRSWLHRRAFLFRQGSKDVHYRFADESWSEASSASCFYRAVQSWIVGFSFKGSHNTTHSLFRSPVSPSIPYLIIDCFLLYDWRKWADARFVDRREPLEESLYSHMLSHADWTSSFWPMDHDRSSLPCTFVLVYAKLGRTAGSSTLWLWAPLTSRDSRWNTQSSSLH